MSSFRLFLISTVASAALVSAGGFASDDVAPLMAEGFAAQVQRNIGDASRSYRKALALEPPSEPTLAQSALALALAPRLYTTATEFFPLKDVVAILHPQKPVIAYHLFWEDDIAYPADNEPSDHEIVWVEFDPATQRAVRVWTYFHGRVLESPSVVEEVNAHQGRVRIDVEWGFHGSVPSGALPQAKAKLQEHWELAHCGQPKSHPLARGWPRIFAGTMDDYVNYSVLVDPTRLLAERKMIYVSRWPTAVINQHCLRYNFAAKAEWPWLVTEKP